jgi:membrane protease YdiL (CAAX protease family)
MSVPTAPPSLLHPHPEPRTYPLMLRTWTYAWWKPVVGLLLLPFGMLVLAPLVMLPVLVAAVAVDHEGSFGDAFEDAASLDSVSWQSMLYLNLSLAGLILVTWGIIRFVHRMRPRWLMSVQPGIRWRFFWACFGIALIAIFANVVVGSFLPTDPNELSTSTNEITSTVVVLGIVILLTTPLQAIGEEYAFRGYAMQAFGSLSRRPWLAIVLSAVLFALAHGIQNAPLFLDRLTFGLMAGYVVYRTGGLEAGIAMHVWNNLIAFGFALLLGDIDDSLNVTEISWWNIPLTFTQNGVYLLLVLLVARRMGIRNRTTPPVPAAEGAVLPPTTPPV